MCAKVRFIQPSEFIRSDLDSRDVSVLPHTHMTKSCRLQDIFSLFHAAEAFDGDRGAARNSR